MSAASASRIRIAINGIASNVSWSPMTEIVSPIQKERKSGIHSRDGTKRRRRTRLIVEVPCGPQPSGRRAPARRTGTGSAGRGSGCRRGPTWPPSSRRALRPRAAAAGAGRRRSPSNTRRRSAAQDRPSPTRASQSIEPGWAGTPRRTSRPPSRRSRRRTRRPGRCWPRPPSGTRSTRSRPADERVERRLHRVRVVLDVVDRRDLRSRGPRPWP